MRQGLYDTLARLADGGTTVLLSSHALEALEGRVERVLILDRGRLVAAGSMAELRGIARLPLRLRLTLAETAAAPPAWLAAAADLHRFDGRVVELACAPEAKMALLRRAAEDAHVADVELRAPTLDELHAHFLRGHGQARGDQG